MKISTVETKKERFQHTPRALAVASEEDMERQCSNASSVSKVVPAVSSNKSGIKFCTLVYSILTR